MRAITLTQPWATLVATRRLYLELGVRVRRRREALDKTQEELATDVGVSRSYIANIERGQQHAPVHVLLGLAEALRVEMGELLPTRAQSSERATNSATSRRAG